MSFTFAALASLLIVYLMAHTQQVDTDFIPIVGLFFVLGFLSQQLP